MKMILISTLFLVLIGQQSYANCEGQEKVLRPLKSFYTYYSKLQKKSNGRIDQYYIGILLPKFLDYVFGVGGNLGRLEKFESGIEEVNGHSYFYEGKFDPKVFEFERLLNESFRNIFQSIFANKGLTQLVFDSDQSYQERLLMAYGRFMNLGYSQHVSKAPLISIALSHNFVELVNGIYGTEVIQLKGSFQGGYIYSIDQKSDKRFRLKLSVDTR
ncbi:hypothetical protein OAB57_03805 [Bacteriovoracaceae bacterium]|nr:hypothetical protein [Bacteriovoracaceae bacterium]